MQQRSSLTSRPPPPPPPPARTQIKKLASNSDGSSERNKRIANELIREIGATDAVSIVLRRLCEDAAHHDEDEKVLLDGPCMADLLLDAKDILAAETNALEVAANNPESPTGTEASTAAQMAALAASAADGIEMGDGTGTGGEQTSVFYPTMETGTSCVITLQTKVTAPGGKKSQIDSFLANLSNAYKGAMRDENSQAKLRISLIAEQGKGPQVQALEFKSERDYWGLVAAITRALVRKEDVMWTGFCEIPSSTSGSSDSSSSSSSSSSSATSAAKKSLLGMLGVSKAAKHLEQSDPDKVEIDGINLRITSNGILAYSLDLGSLRALALTSDWVEPKPYLLEIRLANEAETIGLPEVSRNLGGIRLALMGTNLEPVLSPQYYRRTLAFPNAAAIGAGINENILLPLSLKEVTERKSVNGLTSVAVLTGTKYNTMESTPAGIHTIPFSTFWPSASSGNSPRRPSTQSFLDESAPQLRLNDPLIATVAITQEAPRRAVKVYIKSCTDIPSSRMGPPSAYCAVYLVDDKNNKVNDVHGVVIEAKTGVDKATNPTWNKEVVLEGGPIGLDSVFGVMITVKDAGGGLLKPLHLGQVVIPIGCFIEGHEASLCLPLEPTERMPQHILTLGEIHVATQLVTIGEAGNYSTSPLPSPAHRSSSNGGRSPEGSGGSGRGRSLSQVRNSVAVSYTLRPAAAMGVWWPFRILGGGGQATGHLACRQSFLRLSLSPGHGGPLLNCLEARAAGQRHPGTFVTLDWGKVVSAVALTESTLMMTIAVTKVVPAVGKGRPGSAMAEMELLVAPCPSRKLYEALLDRQELHSVRSELTQLGVTIAKGSKSSSGAPSQGRARQQSVVSQQQNTGLSADAVLPVARVILDDLERVVLEAGKEMARCNTAQPAEEYGAFGSPSVMVSLAPCAATSALLKERAIRKQARARLYKAQLIHICRHLRNAPVFTTAGVQALCNADCLPALDHAPLTAATLATGIVERQVRLENQAIDNLTSFILCSAEYWHPASAGPSSNSFTLAGAPLVGEGPTVDLNSPTVMCLTDLIRLYHETMRQLLSPYLSSAEAFKRTPGQEAKIAILRLIMERNLEFDGRVRDRLKLLGLDVSPPLTLLAPYSLTDLVGWYSSSLVVETQTWLSKTLQNAALFKLNTSNLPWDYEELGGKVMSTLPETLQQQMNIYLHLVDADIDTSRRGTDPNTLGVLVSVREKIVEAVGRCMLLLSDEYRRALQSKHWEQATRPGDDTEKNFCFLLAVCNDCLRVCAFQAAAQELGSGPGPEVQYTVVSAFNGTADIAIKHLVRITFFDAQTLLADFVDYWAVPAEQATKTLLQTITSFLQLLRPRLDERLVEKVTSSCLDVCVLRFLLLLKERAQRSKRFSSEEVRRFVADVTSVKAYFVKAAIPWGQTAQEQATQTQPGNLSKQLACLQDSADLLQLPLAPQLKSLMRVVAKETTFSRAGGLLVLACVVQLRPDFSSELEAAARAAVDEASKVPPTWHPGTEEEGGLIQRVFGQAEGVTKASDVGGGGGGGAFKQLREKASNALRLNKRKMEEEDLRVLRTLGLDMDPVTEEEDTPTPDDDDRSSIAGSALGVALMNIDEADLVLISISRIEVRGLQTASFFGSVNPYVAITLGGQRLKTSVAWSSANGSAKWKTLTLTFRYARSRLANARLGVQVFDKERVRRKRSLGGVSVKLAGLDLFRIESFFALEGGETSAGKRQGEIFICIDVNR